MKTLSFLALAVLAACATPPERAPRSADELAVARRTEDTQRTLELRLLSEKFLRHAEAKQGKAIDFLIISGGGDWGAFGAGVLKGWGRVKGDLARPQFDVVTGVSTGALIAPFAFLGDEASIDRVIELYRNPQKDTAVSRGLLFFLPDNPSLYVLPGLERELRDTMQRAMLERIVAEGEKGRVLLVNTTNVDLGDNRVWDLVAEARRALAGDEDRLRRVLLASAGIPAVFPARGIDEYLHVDGAITGNILYGGETREQDSVHARWHARHPKRAMPRLRYWVIFNNQVRFPPQITRERWPDIMGRTTIMATQTSTLNSLRHLYAMAEVARLKYKADIEVRLITVPEHFVPSKPGTFVKEVMNDLADLGERMGADPASWRTEAP